MENYNFVNDEEKMVDYWDLTKEQFLSSYSYLTEEEYDITRAIVGDRNNILAKLRYLIAKADIYDNEIYVWQDDDSTVGIDVGGHIWSNFLNPETAECEVRCLIKGYQLGKRRVNHEAN